MSDHRDNNALPPPPPLPLPPDPPTTARSAANTPDEFYAQQQQHRHRQITGQPHSITTTFLRSQGSSPLSQTHVSEPAGSGQSSAGNTPYPFSPNTPVPMTPSALHPQSCSLPLRSPMEPYNPRQWTQTRQVSGSQMVFGRSGTHASSTREATGMEGACRMIPLVISIRQRSVVESTGMMRHPLRTCLD